MISTQLDLFGGLPKPPKKITIDDEPAVENPALVEQKLENQGNPEEVPGEGVEEQPAAEVHVQMPEENEAPESPVWVENVSQPLEEPIERENPINNEDFISEEPKVLSAFEVELPAEEANEMVAEKGIADSEISELNDIGLVSIESVSIEFNNEISEDTNLQEIEGELVGESIQMDSLEAMEELVNETETEIEEVEPESLVDNVDLDESVEVEILDNQMIEEAEVSQEDVHADASIMEDKGEGLKIPDDSQLYSRQYYTMRETAAMFQVNQSLIRFWENEFDILKPKKNRKGDRYFRPDDIKNLELIYHLLKIKKFTINGAREHMKTNAKMLNNFEMVQRLEKLKSFLVELKTNL